MIDKFFNDLLHYSGENPNLRLAPFLEYLDLKTDFNFFIIFILEAEYTGDEINTPDFVQFQMELLNILDLLKEKLCCFTYFHYLTNADQITCIIGHNSHSKRKFLQSVHNTLAEITEAYSNHPYTLNIGIGTLTENIWELPTSFASASKALKYRFFFPHQNIFDAKDALGKEFSLLSFTKISEEELIRLICAKDEIAIENWLQEFFLKLTSQTHDKNMIFIRIYSLLGQILNFLYEMNLETFDLEKEILDVYKRFDSFKTYEQFVKWIKKLCIIAYQKLDSSMENYHNQVYQIALGYIKENFEHNTLCLNEIALYANISPAYLSTLFKKVSGQSISDTISGFRIETACRYLSDTNLSLKEISNKCGYANQYYFSNSFKKKIGISPSAYREKSHNSLRQTPRDASQS